jgi:hypothetical protein
VRGRPVVGSLGAISPVGGIKQKGLDMDEIVKCDSCGVDTIATGFCRVDGFRDSDGFWFSGSFNVAVGLCDSCNTEWEEVCGIIHQ